MVLVSAVAGLALGAPLAFAHDESEANGGHCEYGDFSINIENDCDTSNNGGQLEEARPILRPVLNEG
ncbi:MAG: hypothetical protein ACT4O0_03060 [Pseudonocardia sp.]